jgi:predicted TPR repeat methyltransferase
MSERMSEGLEKVYAARAAEELADAYSLWSTDYDRETLSLGYCLPFMITAFVARYVPTAAGPLLDAGCGTGLTGPYLAALGYREIEGLDMSDDMLAHAAGRGCYSAFTRAMMGGPLPLASDRFACTFSTGVFTEGHAPAESLVEMVRITRPGGHVIFTIRDSVFERGGFSPQLDQLTRDNAWIKVEESAPFRAFAIAEPDVLVKAWVFRKL